MSGLLSCVVGLVTMAAMRVVSRVWAALALGAAVLAFAALLLSAPGSRAVSAARRAKRRPVLTFYFGLKRPEAKAMAAFWAVQRPGSASYRRFLSSGRDRSSLRRLAGDAQRVRRCDEAARAARDDRPDRGIRAGKGTKAQLERAFHVKITSLPDETATHYQTNRLLRLPATVKPLVQEVVATFERTVRPVKGVTKRLTASDAAAAMPVAVAGPKNEGRWTRGCAAARRLGGYSFGQIRHAYGIDEVGPGAGGSVAILNDEESILPSDGVATARCFRLPGRPGTACWSPMPDEPVQPRHA